jgi:hypothetical protein
MVAEPSHTPGIYTIVSIQIDLTCVVVGDQNLPHHHMGQALTSDLYFQTIVEKEGRTRGGDVGLILE